jgi:hypothetical protein
MLLISAESHKIAQKSEGGLITRKKGVVILEVLGICCAHRDQPFTVDFRV